MFVENRTMASTSLAGAAAVVCRILSIFRKAASRGPSALADILVSCANLCNLLKHAARKWAPDHVSAVFTARRLAKRGICRRRVSVCLSVCLCVCVCVCVCHNPVLYQNG